MNPVPELERRLGVVFRDKNLLKQALTHRSYLNENREWPLGSNERLEFLGDAVLELVVSEFLFRRYPNKPEGKLTEYRAALVNGETNAATGIAFGINDCLLLSKGEAKDTGRARELIIADAFEAVIGAVYLDQGYPAAENLIARCVLSKADSIISIGFLRNTKSRLQELVQERMAVTPSYRVISETGPDHKKEFLVGVFFGDDLVAQGAGTSKKLAEEKAAQAALVSKGWTTA